MRIASLAAIACLAWESTGEAQTVIFGLKTCGSGSSACGNTTLPDSLPPASLFSFHPDGSGFTDIGRVTVNSTEIDADGLAISPTLDLYAFELHKSGFDTVGSTLIAIDPNTAVAAEIGSVLNNRDIRGAVFDFSGTLWAIDAESNELLNIDASTGMVLDNPVSLTLGEDPFDLSDASDIAINQNGEFFLADLGDFYTLDIETGILSFLNTDVEQIAGIAFVSDPLDDNLYAFDVAGFEDLFVYDPDFNKSLLLANIIPSFNAGRGDLAAVVIPEPSAAFLLGLGLAALGCFHCRRRNG